MREIISLQIGQCGNQVGNKFWETICNEHEVNNEGKIPDGNDLVGKIGVYFSQVDTSKETRYVPRSILVDLEPGVIDSIRSGELGALYNPNNIAVGCDSACNNWARGYFSQGGEYIEQVFDIVRKEAESCDCIQAFQMIHSLGGGTGSGFGSLIMSQLHDEFPDILLMNSSILPSSLVSDVVVEPYNTVLTLDQLIEHSSGVFCMDNEALYKICVNNLKLKRVSYNVINGLIATTLSGVTTSLRFPGQLNSDVRKLSTNMVPFPRLHFYMTGLSPLIQDQVKSFNKNNIAEITRALFEPANILCNANPKSGRYLTFAAIYRGDVSMNEVDNEICKFQNKNSTSFVEWIPNNAKVVSCNVPLREEKLSATFIANNTSIQDCLRRARDQYLKMIKRKAFLHWFTMNGLEELQFMEAEANLTDIISDYEQHTFIIPEEYSWCYDSDLEDSLEELDSGFGGT